MSEVPGSILGADVQFSFLFLVEKNLMTVKKFVSVAKMAPTVYDTETCPAARPVASHAVVFRGDRIALASAIRSPLKTTAWEASMPRASTHLQKHYERP